MLNLYFGNFVSIASTALLMLTLAFVLYALIKRPKPEKWGRYILALVLLGLLLCSFVVMRDNYVGSINYAIDGVSKQGLFSINSIQSLLGSIGGITIFLLSFSSIIVKNQKYRQIVFYIISTIFLFKFILIEASRIWRL